MRKKGRQSSAKKRLQNMSIAESFYSAMQENDCESLPSDVEVENFNPRDLLKNNKINETASKIMSLQLYKRDESAEPKVIKGLT